MKYQSTAPKTIKHQVDLDYSDVRNAIYAWLKSTSECCRTLNGTERTDVRVTLTKAGAKVTWETDPSVLVLAPEAEPTAMAKAAQDFGGQVKELMKPELDASHRSGKFAVIDDHGDQARTGAVVATYDDYEDADRRRFEDPSMSDRASIVWVLKSGSRYNADKTTFARDDDDEEDED